MGLRKALGPEAVCLAHSRSLASPIQHVGAVSSASLLPACPLPPQAYTLLWLPLLPGGRLSHSSLFCHWCFLSSGHNRLAPGVGVGLCHTRRMTWPGALSVAHREGCAVAVCQVRGEPPGGRGRGRPSLTAADPPGVEPPPAYSANSNSPALICPGRQPRNLGPQAPPPVGSPSQAAPFLGTLSSSSS